MLKLDRDFMEQTGKDARQQNSIVRINAFLRRRVDPLKDTDEKTLNYFTRHNIQVARSYRIHSEQGHALFCLLQIAMHGQAQEDPSINYLLSRPGGDPEQDLRNLIDGFAEAESGDG